MDDDQSSEQKVSEKEVSAERDLIKDAVLYHNEVLNQAEHKSSKNSPNIDRELYNDLASLSSDHNRNSPDIDAEQLAPQTLLGHKIERNTVSVQDRTPLVQNRDFGAGNNYATTQKQPPLKAFDVEFAQIDNKPI